MRFVPLLFATFLPCAAHALDTASVRASATEAATAASNTASEASKAALDSRQQFIQQIEAQQKSYLDGLLSGSVEKALQEVSGANSAPKRPSMFQTSPIPGRYTSSNSALTGLYRSPANNTGTLHAPSYYNNTPTPLQHP